MSRFSHTLRNVAVVHVAILVAVLLTSLIRQWIRPRPELSLPVTFMVEPAAAAVPPSVPVPRPAPPVQPLPPQPVRALDPAPTPPPARQRVRRPIETSTTRVTRGGPSRPAPSVAEVERLLSRGVPPSDLARIPDQDTRGFARVQHVLYEAWQQPSRDDVGNTVVQAVIVLDASGRITGRRLLGRSGNAALDSSVLQALNAVRLISGLPSGFASRHKEITIAFKVE